MSILKPNRRKDRERDPEYLDFVRNQPCVCCEIKILRYAHVTDNPGIRPAVFLQASRTEAAHSGPHALGQKASDSTAIPLCGLSHHREGPESYHKLGVKFFVHWGIDLNALLDELWAQFELETGRGESVLDATEAVL